MSEKRRPSKQDQLLLWFLKQETLELIRSLTGPDFEAGNPVLAQYTDIQGPAAGDWENFFRSAGRIQDAVTNSETKHILHDAHLYYRQWKEEQNPKQRSSHQEKRTFLLNLSMNYRSYSVSEAIICGERSVTLPCGIRLDLIQRDPDPVPPFKSYHRLYDLDGSAVRADTKAYIVDEKLGFLIVDPNQSVLFYSGHHTTFTKENVQLVVIRGVAATPPHKIPDSGPSDSWYFYDYLTNVIDFSCDVRRNQRPTHPGHMAQAGITQGSRHLRGPSSATQIGYEVSYTANLSTESKQIHDEEVNGVSGVMWSLILSMMPTEVTQPMQKALQENEIPHFATRQLEPGRGFRLLFDDREFLFPNASRAPPEIFLTRGYTAWSHTDPKYAPFAFNLCSAREMRHQSRSASNVTVSQYGGSNFVEINLRVVVVNAVGTLFGFDSEHHHGTTVSGGTTNYELTFVFSKRIAEALTKLGDQKAFGECYWGAGEGNPDNDEDKDDE